MLILSVFCYIIRAINYVFVVLKVMLYMSDRLIDNKELMKEWNQEKNILYNPADLTSGSSKKVWWKCKNGHEWEAVIHTRVKGVGCPYCMGKKAIQGVNDFATLYPEMLKEWDYEENDKLGIKPNELLVGSIKKVYCICSKGHKYDRSIYDRLHGRGNCPYCGNRKVLQGYNDLATTNPELLKDWDYEENDKLGIKPNEITNGGKEKVWWKCEKGHKWNSIIRSRITGSGCPYCSNNLVKKGYNDIATTNPELLEEWDYEKNDKLGIFPSNLSHGSTKLVWWKCEKGHEWQSSIPARIRNDKLYNRCPICSSYLRTSIPEKIIFYYVHKKFSKTIANYKPEWLKPKEIDIFIPELNVGIEYDGYYYHKDIKHDIEKDDLCSKNNVRIIRIREKKSKPINSSAIIYNIKIDNNTDYTYVEDALSFLNSYLNIDLDFDIRRDLDDIIKMINFMEKENCISKTNPEVLQEWNYEKNDKLGIKPENVVLNSTKMIHWKCKNGHEWTTTLNNRARGSNCPYCSGRYAISGENDIATLFPELLKEWDYEKNDQLGIKPQNVKKNTDKKVWWKCEKGHEYKSSIVNRTKSKGTCCPYCSGNKVLKGFNDIASTNPELLKEWDYSKNTIKPDEVTKGTHKKIWWICSNNHSYEATIPARRRGTGCPYCSGNKILVGFNDLATTNPELLEKWNYEKNNKLGITPKSISKSYSKKVWWKCKNGHEYQRHVYNERKGSGRCPICKKLKL